MAAAPRKAPRALRRPWWRGACCETGRGTRPPASERAGRGRGFAFCGRADHAADVFAIDGVHVAACAPRLLADGQLVLRDDHALAGLVLDDARAEAQAAHAPGADHAFGGGVADRSGDAKRAVSPLPAAVDGPHAVAVLVLHQYLGASVAAEPRCADLGGREVGYAVSLAVAARGRVCHALEVEWHF